MPSNPRAVASTLALAGISTLGACTTAFVEPATLHAAGGSASYVMSCENPDPQIAGGTGEQAFVPVADGDAIEIIRGPQGGWHIVGSVRVANLSEFVTIDFTLTDVESGTEVSVQRSQTSLFAPYDDCIGEKLGLLGVFDPALIAPLQGGDNTLTPCDLFGGHTVRMHFSVTEALVDSPRTLEQDLDIVAYAAPECWPDEA
ncbi:hypothetical protein L6R50_01500 [Myxococcota bacterium]|nr:hypothetical protein [Myxococcota bacterium]